MLDHQTSQPAHLRPADADEHPLPAGPVAALAALEQWLCAHLIEREEAVHAALIALVAREHLLLVGPPGTAKSLLVTLLARALVDPTGQPLPTFSYLMSRFTTLDDLFGPISLPQLKQERYVRITRGRLAEARLAFLDEVLRGSDPSLEALLTLMNERLFDNDGARLSVPLHCLFGATNSVNLPQNPEGKTGAVWDRFVLRVPVHYVQPGSFLTLLARPRSQSLQQPPTVPEADLLTLQDLCGQVAVPTEVYQALFRVRTVLLEKGVTISDRRWQQSVSILQARALLAGRTHVLLEDLRILRLVLWQKLEHQGEIARLLIGLVSPAESEILEIEDQAESVLALHYEARQDASLTEEVRMKAAMEALAKLKQGCKRLELVRQRMQAQGLSSAPVETALSAQHARMLSIQETIVEGI
jgi:MoxR-like ATPase